MFRLRRVIANLLAASFLLAAIGTPLFAQNTPHTWNESLARQASTLLRDDEWFAAAIVQDGLLYPVEGQRVTLRPAPFAVVIVTHEPDGILMNASVRPDIYRGVVKKRTLDEILAEPGMFMGMAEGLFNDEETLFVSEVMPHYFFYSSESEHRYDEVEFIDGAVVGHRLVSFLRDLEGDGFGGPQQVIPMSAMRVDLYLSFFHTSWEGVRQLENQSEAVQLEFR